MFPVVLISSVFVLISGQEQDWSYHGERGPLEWPRLFPEDCSLDRQSPININDDSTILDPFLGPLEFEGYEQTLQNSRIINNERTVEIIPNPNEDYIIKNGGLVSRYRLDNIHFHWGSNNNLGSEHVINGMKYPIEAHFVHINENYGSIDEALKYDDGLAVLAVFYETFDMFNPAISSIAEALSSIRYANTERSFELGSPVDSLLPSILSRQCFYRYNGSLTTPNCTEAVIWTVFSKPQKITEQQTSDISNLAMASIREALGGIRYVNTERSFELGSPVDSLLRSVLSRQCFFRYNDSLATPNCIVPVLLTVFPILRRIAEQQLEEFRKVLETEEGSDEINLVDNYRPLQPVNKRQILRSKDFQI